MMRFASYSYQPGSSRTHRWLGSSTNTGGRRGTRVCTGCRSAGKGGQGYVLGVGLQVKRYKGMYWV